MNGPSRLASPRRGRGAGVFLLLVAILALMTDRDTLITNRGHAHDPCGYAQERRGDREHVEGRGVGPVWPDTERERQRANRRRDDGHACAAPWMRPSWRRPYARPRSEEHHLTNPPATP